MNQTKSTKQTLPSVVQLGFSGSRELFKGVLRDAPNALKLCDDVEKWLEQRLAKIAEDLRLEDNQFLVGISQLACGADTIFVKACKKRAIPQRIFLPEYRDNFFGAIDPDGTPDFTPRQRDEAKALLESEHIIQERVVGSSHDRGSRFEETNVEIMRVSDAIVCLIRGESMGQKGGAKQLLNRAIQRGIPVLEIQVTERNGRFEVVEDRWHNVRSDAIPPIQNLADDLAKLPLAPLVSGKDPIPQRDEYFNALAWLAARQAKGKQRLFKFAAVLIIVTHILATVLAASAMASHSIVHSKWPVLILLVIELAFLGVGFAVHKMLHHSHAVREWAISRVVCEIVRSLQAIGTRHLYLDHLFRLQLPREYRPLLRTLSVLHLHSTRPQRDQPWQQHRDQYIRERFDDPVNGQLHYFEEALQKDNILMIRCQKIFVFCSFLAITITAIKLGFEWYEYKWESFLAILGTLAITLPVLAVGGLSWAAAVDCEARVATFEETLQFLRRQRPYLEQATSGSEFDRLLIETETVLLGEITNWYSRRSNKGVS